ncbi:MAG TPA: hypothetical protein VGD40_05845 [Chryseosolibacter sp.]
MSSVDFKTTNYFSGMPYILGFILAPAGLLLLFSPQPVVGGGLLLTGVLILTCHYRLHIDFNKKVYTEYLFLLGLKTAQEKKSFRAIEYVYIKPTKVSQTLNSRVSSTTIQKVQFDGYLKFSDEDKVHLMTLDNKSSLRKRLDPIAATLNTKVIDYSIGNASEVN